MTHASSPIPGAQLTGIIPPLVTPLRHGDALDEEGLERLVGHLIDGGVQGLFILGTSGEAPHLSYRVRRELITRVCAQVAGRLPVLVGITDAALPEAISLAQHASDAGAAFVVSSAPFYFPITQAELRQHVEALLARLPLPLLLYNMPEMTKVVFEPATVAALLQHEQVVGIKDSSGDLEYHRRLLEVTKQRPGFATFVGPENLLVETLRLGGSGGVNGGANIAPELFVALHAAVTNGDLPYVEQLQQRVSILGGIYTMGASGAAVIQGMKCALSLLGICGDAMTEPFQPLIGQERERVRTLLQQADVLHV